MLTFNIHETKKPSLIFPSLLGGFFLLLGAIATIGILGSLNLITLPAFAIAAIAGVGLIIFPPVAGFIILAGLTFSIGLTLLITSMVFKISHHHTAPISNSDPRYSLSVRSEFAPEPTSSSSNNNSATNTQPQQLPIQQNRLKFVVLGFNGIGKTALANKIANHPWEDDYKPTHGADYVETTLESAPDTNLIIWTISQQTPFPRDHDNYIAYIQSSTKTWANGTTKIIILAFSLTDQTSFDDLEKLKSAVATITPAAKFMLVGLKSDDAENRQVTTQKAKEWAKKHHCIDYMEVSSKNDINVNELFTKLTTHCLDSKKPANKPWFW